MYLKRFWTGSLVIGLLALGACTPEEQPEPVEEVTPAADAGVAEEVGFEQWDTDSDTRLSSAEFGTWWRDRGIYDRWNRDAQPGLTGAEFGEGAFGLWDTDNDNRITEAEWTAAATGWYGPTMDRGTFGSWDLNNDGFLDANELGTGLERTGLWNEWDRNRNNLLEDNEFHEGVFGLWDTNDDTFLDTQEWRTGNTDWGVV